MIELYGKTAGMIGLGRIGQATAKILNAMNMNSGKVYAAGLDVVSTEPIKGDNPLLSAKNCLITSHISWAAQAARQRIMNITVDNVKAFMEGNPTNVVNK